MSCSCQWYRVCDAGALRAEPLATLMSCAVKNIKFAHQGSTNGMSTTRVRRYTFALCWSTNVALARYQNEKYRGNGVPVGSE